VSISPATKEQRGRGRVGRHDIEHSRYVLLGRWMPRAPAVGRALPGSVRVVLLRAGGVSFSVGLDRAMFTHDGISGEPNVTRLASLPDQDLGAFAGCAQFAVRRTQSESPPELSGD
jgi:hypothetical protein